MGKGEAEGSSGDRRREGPSEGLRGPGASLAGAALPAPSFLPRPLLLSSCPASGRPPARHKSASSELAGAGGAPPTHPRGRWLWPRSAMWTSLYYVTVFFSPRINGCIWMSPRILPVRESPVPSGAAQLGPLPGILQTDQARQASLCGRWATPACFRSWLFRGLKTSPHVLPYCPPRLPSH